MRFVNEGNFCNHSGEPIFLTRDNISKYKNNIGFK